MMEIRAINDLPYSVIARFFNGKDRWERIINAGGQNRQWLTELEYWRAKGAGSACRAFKDVPPNDRWLQYVI